MTHGVLNDPIDYKNMTSQRINSFLHDLSEDCKNHPSVAFVLTTPGDIRRDPRTKSAIHRLSARIAALEEAENLIRRTRLVAEEELAFLRARVAPISACPHEIIAKILLVTYSSAFEGAGDPTKILLRISQVSRVWRAVAISLTQLWARIHVEWNAKQRALWLERSGTRPLDVYLTIDSPLPQRWLPNQFGEQDLFLHSSRWRSFSLRNPRRCTVGEPFDRLMRSIDLKSLESLKLVSSIYGFDSMAANFQYGQRPESGSALRHLSLRDTKVEALHLAVDNVVTLRLSGIAEEDPHFWTRILGSSGRLERLILSSLYYRSDGTAGSGPAIPVRTHLHNLVLGNGNGRRFFRYMIRELKAPALLSLDICLPECSERYAREIIPMLMAFFRSSPLIQDLTIRMNHFIAIRLLNALRLPHTEEALISSENIFLPHLRRLEFHQLFDELSQNRFFNEFHHELVDFLIFRSQVHWYDVKSGRWKQKDGSKVLECLKVQLPFYDKNDCCRNYVQDFDCIPEGELTPYRFHDLDERRSDADEAETTWDDLDYASGDDDGFDNGLEEADEYMIDWAPDYLL